MITRSVRIPDDIDAGLSTLAETEHMSVNSMIIRAVKELLERSVQEDAVNKATDKVFARRADLFERLADT